MAGVVVAETDEYTNREERKIAYRIAQLEKLERTQERKKRHEVEKVARLQQREAAMCAFHVDEASSLSMIPEAPTFRPTLEEFQDPLAYIRSVQKEAADWGICKIISPVAPAIPGTYVLNNTPDGKPLKFTTRQQTVRQLEWLDLDSARFVQGGRKYTVSEYERVAEEFSRRRFGTASRLPARLIEVSHATLAQELSELLVHQSEYWREVSKRDGNPAVVEYGNDVEGSAFCQIPTQDPLSKSRWNLQVLPRDEESTLRLLQGEIPGVTSPMLYIGMLFATFAWHVEDHSLYSINYQHLGSAKTWYGVPESHADAFEDVVRTAIYNGPLQALAAVGKGTEECRMEALRTLLGKTTMFSPQLLLDNGVRVCRCVQEPGEFVLTFPRAYHAGFSHGFCIGEAVNFAMGEWFSYGAAAVQKYRSLARLPVLPHEQLLCMEASLLPGRLLEACKEGKPQPRGVAHVGDEGVMRSYLALISEFRSHCRQLQQRGVACHDMPAVSSSFPCCKCKTMCFLSSVVEGNALEPLCLACALKDASATLDSPHDADTAADSSKAVLLVRRNIAALEALGALFEMVLAGTATGEDLAKYKAVMAADAGVRAGIKSQLSFESESSDRSSNDQQLVEDRPAAALEAVKTEQPPASLQQQQQQEHPSSESGTAEEGAVDLDQLLEPFNKPEVQARIAEAAIGLAPRPAQGPEAPPAVTEGPADSGAAQVLPSTIRLQQRQEATAHRVSSLKAEAEAAAGASPASELGAAQALRMAARAGEASSKPTHSSSGGQPTGHRRRPSHAGSLSRREGHAEPSEQPGGADRDTLYDNNELPRQRKAAASAREVWLSARSGYDDKAAAAAGWGNAPGLPPLQRKAATKRKRVHPSDDDSGIEDPHPQQPKTRPARPRVSDSEAQDLKRASTFASRATVLTVSNEHPCELLSSSVVEVGPRGASMRVKRRVYRLPGTEVRLLLATDTIRGIKWHTTSSASNVIDIWFRMSLKKAAEKRLPPPQLPCRAHCRGAATGGQSSSGVYVLRPIDVRLIGWTLPDYRDRLRRFVQNVWPDDPDPLADESYPFGEPQPGSSAAPAAAGRKRSTASLASVAYARSTGSADLKGKPPPAATPIPSKRSGGRFVELNSRRRGERADSDEYGASRSGQGAAAKARPTSRQPLEDSPPDSPGWHRPVKSQRLAAAAAHRTWSLNAKRDDSQEPQHRGADRHPRGDDQDGNPRSPRQKQALQGDETPGSPRSKHQRPRWPGGLHVRDTPDGGRRSTLEARDTAVAVLATEAMAWRGGSARQLPDPRFDSGRSGGGSGRSKLGSPRAVSGAWQDPHRRGSPPSHRPLPTSVSPPGHGSGADASRAGMAPRGRSGPDYAVGELPAAAGIVGGVDASAMWQQQYGAAMAAGMAGQPLLPTSMPVGVSIEDWTRAMVEASAMQGAGALNPAAPAFPMVQVLEQQAQHAKAQQQQVALSQAFEQQAQQAHALQAQQQHAALSQALGQTPQGPGRAIKVMDWGVHLAGN